MSLRPDTCPSRFGRGFAFDEHEAFALGERAHRLEAVGLERARAGRRTRTALRARRAGAPRPPRGAGADDHHAAAGAQHARAASRIDGDAIFGAHRAEQPAGVVDDGEVELVGIERQPRRRRDLDLDQHAGVGGALARARRRRFVRATSDRAARQADLAGDRAQASAVRAADLHELIAQLHAGHADDEEMRVVAFQEHRRSCSELSALSTQRCTLSSTELYRSRP